MPDTSIRPGKFVGLTYRIEDDGGQLLEQADIPVSYIHGGQTELIGGLDNAIQGHCVGDELTLVLPPEMAFGPHDPSLTFTDKLENVPPQFRYLGAEVQMQNEQGETRAFRVTRIADGTLTVDGNHPLAGKTLHVFVRIAEVRTPTDAELAADHTMAAGLRPPGVLH